MPSVCGAAEYDDMCSGCHLAPGQEKTEISKGLYPSPPELSRGNDLNPAEQFWVLKHGIKMTGMPAWGSGERKGFRAISSRLADDCAQHRTPPDCLRTNASISPQFSAP
jgi:mono/diheme cytochrome c family protein